MVERALAAIAAAQAALDAPPSADAPPISSLERALQSAQEAHSKAETRYYDAESAHEFWEGSVARAAAPRIALELDDDEVRGECPRCGFQLGAIPKAEAGDVDFDEEEEAEEVEDEEAAAPAVADEAAGAAAS